MKQNEVICCLGDSITAGGLWVGEVYQTLVKRGVKVYNCGVSGDSIFHAIRRIETDCLCYLPTTVIVMFGINDIEHWLLSRDSEESRERIDILVERHNSHLEKAIQLIEAAGSKVVLCDPCPYMEGDGFESENLMCNADLDRCRKNIYRLAEKYHCDVIDVHGAVLKAAENEKIYNEDRVHPNAIGQRVIAAQILKYFGVEPEQPGQKEYIFSDVNLERMKVEEHYKKLMYATHGIIDTYFVEFDYEMTQERLANRIKECLSSPVPYVVECIKLYSENNEDIKKTQDELISRTEEMFAFYQNPVNQFTERIKHADMVLVGIGEAFDAASILSKDEIYQWGCEILRQEQLTWLVPMWGEFLLAKIDHQKVRNSMKKLAELLKDKNYFVVSLSTNSEVVCYPWKHDRIVTPCGTINRKQCPNGHEKLFDVSEQERIQINSVFETLYAECGLQRKACDETKITENLPELGTCPVCGERLVLNNIYAENYVEAGYLPKWELYKKWLQGTVNRKIVIVELGVGLKYPSVIRWPFEKIAFFNEKAHFFRVHERLSQLTPELVEKGTSIAKNPIDWLLDL